MASAVAAEGLVLWRDSPSKTGFRGADREKPPDRKKVRFNDSENQDEYLGQKSDPMETNRKVEYERALAERPIRVAPEGRSVRKQTHGRPRHASLPAGRPPTSTTSGTWPRTPPRT